MPPMCTSSAFEKVPGVGGSGEFVMSAPSPGDDLQLVSALRGESDLVYAAWKLSGLHSTCEVTIW